MTYSNADSISSRPDTLSVTGSSLTVGSVTGSGCAALGIHAGDAASFSGTYTVTSPGGNVTFNP